MKVTHQGRSQPFGWKAKSRQAFTFVEIMMALGVIALTATSTFVSLGAANKFAVNSRVATAAQTLVQNQIDSFLAVGPFYPAFTPALIPTELEVGTTSVEIPIYAEAAESVTLVKGSMTRTVADLGATQTTNGRTDNLNTRRLSVSLQYVCGGQNHTVQMIPASIRLMKRKPNTSAQTLIETIVSMCIVLLIGGLIYTTLNGATILSAKNASINSAHHRMLKSMERLTRDIHASSSTPELVNVDGTIVTSGKAAGVIVQPVVEGPFALTSMGIVSGTGRLTIATGSGTQIEVGQQVICPTCLVEDTITAVAPNAANPSTQRDLTTANSVWTTASLAANMSYPVFIANRSAYVVVEGELRFYRSYTGASSDAYSVLASGVSTATPFSLVSDSTGPAAGTTVTGTLTVNDPTYNQRGYRATDLSVDFKVPYRSRIAP